MSNTTQVIGQRVCPVERAGHLDSSFRRWLQNPQKIVGPYVKAGMTVLDVGCGPGFFSIEMARMVGASGHVIAADLQDGMLQKLRDKIQGTELESRITLHQCGRQRIGWTEPVDFALAFYMVHELPDQDAFFREIGSLLTSNGHVFIVEPPFHVSKAAFKETVSKAQRAGFTPVAKPRVALSKTALLMKDWEGNLS
jgi:ubiquinone/menaquinone biosynthesis C-methylase UbiE